MINQTKKHQKWKAKKKKNLKAIRVQMSQAHLKKIDFMYIFQWCLKDNKNSI